MSDNEEATAPAAEEADSAPEEASAMEAPASDAPAAEPDEAADAPADQAAPASETEAPVEYDHNVVSPPATTQGPDGGPTEA